MALPAKKLTTYQGINVSYTTYNLEHHQYSTPVLCFLHGWCCSSALWSSQYPLYANYPSILIDLPGHGHSDKPQSIDWYSREFSARAVNAVFEAENVPHVVLIGHSMGGFLATMILRIFGEEKIKGIVYVVSFWLMPVHYLNAVQRAAWAEDLKDDAKFFKVFEENFAAHRTEDSVVAKVRKTMIDDTSMHARVNMVATDALPHHWRWDEVYGKTPMVHFSIKEAPQWDEQYKRHLPSLSTEYWEGVSIFFFMEAEAGDEFNRRVEQFLTENWISLKVNAVDG